MTCCPCCLGTGLGDCLLTNNENRLPDLRDYTDEAGRPDRRIHHQHQAIIPSYKFNCCGNITEWGVDVNPPSYGNKIITFDFDFQVWRPSPTVNATGCYSLVNNFIVTSVSLPDQPASEHVARVTPSPQDQLQFRPGDVLGFYVESHGEGSQSGGDDNNGVVLLNSAGYTSELVWFGHITSQTSHSGSCPYPVSGTTGVLDSSTRAAPVISVSITTYSCHQSLSGSSSNHGGLISGVVVTIIVVCLLIIVIITAVIVVKRCRKKLGNSGMALSNQVYGELNHVPSR